MLLPETPNNQGLLATPFSEEVRGWAAKTRKEQACDTGHKGGLRLQLSVQHVPLVAIRKAAGPRESLFLGQVGRCMKTGKQGDGVEGQQGSQTRSSEIQRQGTGQE